MVTVAMAVVDVMRTMLRRHRMANGGGLLL